MTRIADESKTATARGRAWFLWSLVSFLAWVMWVFETEPQNVKTKAAAFLEEFDVEPWDWIEQSKWIDNAITSLLFVIIVASVLLWLWSKLRRDHDVITVCDAIQYICQESKWGIKQRLDEIDESASSAIEQAAYDDKLIVKGKRESMNIDERPRLFEHIQNQYWQDHKIDLLATCTDKRCEGGKTEHHRFGRDDQGVTRYDSLVISRRDMNRIWPRAWLPARLVHKARLYLRDKKRRREQQLAY